MYSLSQVLLCWYFQNLKQSLWCSLKVKVFCAAVFVHVTVKLILLSESEYRDDGLSLHRRVWHYQCLWGCPTWTKVLLVWYFAFFHFLLSDFIWSFSVFLLAHFKAFVQLSSSHCPLFYWFIAWWVFWCLSHNQFDQFFQAWVAMAVW